MVTVACTSCWFEDNYKSWEVERDALSPEGYIVCHNCGTPVEI